MSPGPIEEQYEYAAAEAVAEAYPEGGWREHLARLEARVRRIERWIEGDPDADSETEPAEREP